MNWRVDTEQWKEYLDDLAARIRDRQARGGGQLTIHLKAAERLVKEARKMQRVRERVKRRMERDEYDEIMDDIHEILED